ncbi:L,D-transpeptidase [Sphingomonas sp. LB-2]|nr:L,D-transpeptidase [Sphingomonas caeni]
MKVALLALAGLAALHCAPVHAQQPLDTPTVMEAVERLKPGEFLWVPEIAPAGPVLLIVSLATQRAVLYRNGVPIGISTVSTGRPGYATPTGVFTVLEKDAEHYSSIYDNAPMPYMQRLTWGGVALHGGQLPGYPASHGCIRLPAEFARLLYGVTHIGMTVIVTDVPALPRIAPGDPGVAADGERWHPENAPIGQVSIVVSGADQRVIVLRNGREIGSAPVSIKQPLIGTAAYILRPDGRWFGVPLPGQSVPEAPVTGLGEQFEVSAAFREAVAGVVVPGTTIILTADTLRSTVDPRLERGRPPLLD